MNERRFPYWKRRKNVGRRSAVEFRIGILLLHVRLSTQPAWHSTQTHPAQQVHSNLSMDKVTVSTPRQKRMKSKFIRGLLVNYSSPCQDDDELTRSWNIVICDEFGIRERKIWAQPFLPAFLLPSRQMANLKINSDSFGIAGRLPLSQLRGPGEKSE